MSTYKHFDRICCVAVIIALLITTVFLNADAFGITAADRTIGYENRLFDTSTVHTIDIVMDDWDGFLDTCQNEEYSMCTIVIDGESYKNVGIRGKGNTSLSNVASMNSERYSFKVEFDQYDSTSSYYGLDKLCLNNIIQDNTYMKDYLAYQMMNAFGVDSPLCSYAYITVNGDDWGLYLAVEGIEDGFLYRNYGNDSGELYKPDSMSFGGGRGNGKDFNMEDFNFGDFDFSDIDFSELQENFAPDRTSTDNENMQSPQGFDPTSDDNGDMQPPQGFDPTSDDKMGDFGGMGSNDVKLQYIDDDPSSYSNIFDNAKTDITEEDQTRLIASLKSLSSYENIENIINIDEVLRYFVVHNFVVNGDSYTGSMIHNYYLYEKDGQLSMIPWDYNLAFGTFQGSNANSAVNDSIDYSDGSMDDRPMLNWIFEKEEYTELYYQYFEEFISEYFDSGYFTELIDSTIALISPYVEKDPTKFCTYEEFELGAKTLKEFCLLRAESVRLQIEDSDETVDASSITLSDMGTMNSGGGMGGNFGSNIQMPIPDNAENFKENMQIPDKAENFKENMQIPDKAENFKENMQIPDNIGNFNAEFDNNSGGSFENNTMQDTFLLLGICGILLVAGLLFAWKYHRY